MEAYKHAVRRVTDIVKTVQDGAHKLENFERVCISNVNVGFPPGAALVGQSIDGQAWPSGADLAKALSEFHTTKQQLHSSYHLLPTADKDVVIPPSSL